jgi:3-hydroxyisobutyrate dehydrogenase-like beta-hydroxyacid dehydrogenase
MKVGFIGLGRMGAAMARSLLRASHEVAVYKRTPGLFALRTHLTGATIVVSCGITHTGIDVSHRDPRRQHALVHGG